MKKLKKSKFWVQIEKKVINTQNFHVKVNKQ